MNLLERELHYPLGDTLPQPGEAMEVAPGVRWIRMRLPFALDHINLWLLRDTLDGVAGWTVVDCCIDHAESRAQWEQIFETQLQGLPILRVIVTHMHPDHIGLAHWLCERWKAPMWISSTDYHVARVLSTAGDTLAGGEQAASFFASHGMTDPEALDKIRGRTNYYAELVPAVPDTFVRMLDGDTVTIDGHAWRCIVGYGHAPEHIALFCDEQKLLLGGDMMLPRISTNVSVHAGEPEANSLRLFLDSIDKFKALPADTLGLPSHGKPFTGIHRRVEQLQEHHRDRLAELLEACLASPLTGAQGLPILFKRQLDVHQMTFAMGETVAHLHLLWFSGQVKRELGKDGIYRFGAKASTA
ncbi:MBL fold metallo-hydrolase [Variovorax sp. J22G73]|uniref:MBL fold metallo-hydrolase n=1 Tax=unclassified Variovorax TaxID=663243 RepID=UPI002575AB9E|nr:MULTISPECIES: MBL fold metallo-hydrolase [unclassified Variovorax]MDM0006807.1 MBL fold metallo-hydrolase [Variovorax sp. J22R203]MDM0099441.1 MBL fold metallo-hydrolase [Variovorax sp. J22G73]